MRARQLVHQALRWSCLAQPECTHAAGSLSATAGPHLLSGARSHAATRGIYTAPTPAQVVFDSAVKARHRDRAAYHLLRAHEAELAAACASSSAGASSSQSSSQETSAHQGTSSPIIGIDTSTTSTSTRKGYRGDALLGGVTSRLLDRLLDVRARAFPHALVVGGAAVHVLDQIAGGVAGIERVTVVDSSPDMLDAIKVLEAHQRQAGPADKQWPRLEYVLMAEAPEPNQDLSTAPAAGEHERTDAEKRGAQMYELLPVEPGTYDLVVSSVGLHWINDLPGLMFQCRLALKPDGLFLAALFGGESLQELRIACAVAAMERAGGIFPVVSPFAQMRDGGNLLTRAGFALPAVDCDAFVLKYQGDTPNPAAPEQQQQQQQSEQGQSVASSSGTVSSSSHASSRDSSSSAHGSEAGTSLGNNQSNGDLDGPLGPEAVVAHLRLMGESNAVIHRQRKLRADLALAAGAAYRAMFQEEDGTIPATFEVMYLTGWTPHESQQKPARRGSQSVSIQDLAGLGTPGSTNEA